MECDCWSGSGIRTVIRTRKAEKAVIRISSVSGSLNSVRQFARQIVSWWDRKMLTRTGRTGLYPMPYPLSQCRPHTINRKWCLGRWVTPCLGIDPIPSIGNVSRQVGYPLSGYRPHTINRKWFLDRWVTPCLGIDPIPSIGNGV